jgi:hypothetical protein
MSGRRATHSQPVHLSASPLAASASVRISGHSGPCPLVVGVVAFPPHEALSRVSSYNTPTTAAMRAVSAPTSVEIAPMIAVASAIQFLESPDQFLERPDGEGAWNDRVPGGAWNARESMINPPTAASATPHQNHFHTRVRPPWTTLLSSPRNATCPLSNRQTPAAVRPLQAASASANNFEPRHYPLAGETDKLQTREQSEDQDA